MTDSSVSTKEVPKKHKVMIPVRATISVPVEVDYTGDVSSDIYGEYNGDVCVDVENNPELLESALKACTDSADVEDALVVVMRAMLDYKVHHPNSKVFYTRFAGFVDEREL